MRGVLPRPVALRTRARRAGVRRWLAYGLVVLVAWCVACGTQRGTIGALLGRQPSGELVVHEVPARLGASKAGLEPGDQVLLIDGKDVRAMSTEQVHQALSGDVGEPVKLTVVRGEEVVRLTIKRSAARSRRPTKSR